MATRTSTAPIAEGGRPRAALALRIALVVLTAALIAAAIVSALRAMPAQPAGPAAAPRPLIATCRPCADEALGGAAALLGAATMDGAAGLPEAPAEPRPSRQAPH